MSKLVRTMSYHQRKGNELEKLLNELMYCRKWSGSLDAMKLAPGK